MKKYIKPKVMCMIGCPTVILAGSNTLGVNNEEGNGIQRSKPSYYFDEEDEIDNL